MTPPSPRARIATLALALACLVSAAGAGVAAADRPGPRLTVSGHELARALYCSGDLAAAQRATVLLIPGTTLNPSIEFSWNWLPALERLGWPHCTLALPNDGMSDVQVAGEYVVLAIRRVHGLSGRKLQIVGHSQGGMVPRWAFRFWPDTRAMVDDLVGLSPSNHGTVDANAFCAVPGGGCPPSFWQQRVGSNFLEALNSPRETFAGISYSSIYTNVDEVVAPNVGPSASSALRGGGAEVRNVAIQEVCPLDLSEHLAIGTYDNIAYHLVIDALTHAGPAAPFRVARSECLRPFMPGVNGASFASDYAKEIAYVARRVATYPRVRAEPPLACYAGGRCTSRRAAGRR